jgi:hypothetical protein
VAAQPDAVGNAERGGGRSGPAASARISASLSRSLIGSSRSRATVLVTPRYASRNSTAHRRAVLDVDHRHDLAARIGVGTPQRSRSLRPGRMRFRHPQRLGRSLQVSAALSR